MLTYDELRQHLEERHVNLSVHHPLFGDGVVVFPLWTLTGQLAGVQQYRPFASKTKSNDANGRYFTERTPGVVSVFGVESLHLSNVIFVTEGIFDATRITSMGYSAIAVLSTTGIAGTKQWLASLGRPTIAVCDNDPPMPGFPYGVGMQLAELTDYHYQMPTNRDMGLMSDFEAVNIIRRCLKLIK